MNQKTFYNSISELSNTFKNRDLEEYLRALYKIIENNKEKKLTDELVLEMIKDAFLKEPYVFNEQWLQCNRPPEKNTDVNTLSKDVNPYTFTIEVLKFQIADLYKMRNKQLQNEYRYFGVESETGHSWSNFDPLTILECGAAGLEANDFDFSALDWSFIGKLLEMGRIYE